MFSAAAGISTTGTIPIVNTFGVFGSMRAVEQYRNSICYPNFNVKAVISHQGIDVGPDGPTHQDIGDLGVLRSIPNTCIISPADRIEMHHMVRWMMNHHGPVYMRTGRSNFPSVHGTSLNDYSLIEGQWPIIKNGKDITLVSNAAAMRVATEAAKILEKNGVSVLLLNASWIKPIDEKYLVDLVKDTKGIITIEDHNVKGGIGTIISDIMSQYYPMKVAKIGVNDTFAESGEWEELYEKYGISTEKVIEQSKKILES